MIRAHPPREISVLVIDDSAPTREALVGALQRLVGVRVVGVAADGQEGLERALALQPDFITVDLEMPRMDGFTFLRVLMARAPCPVLVVSSHGGKDKVFQALELGAVDFIAKPDREAALRPEALKAVLMEKVRIVRALRRSNLGPCGVPAGAAAQAPGGAGGMWVGDGTEGRRGAGASKLVPVIAIGASTGGPAALQRILRALPGDLPAAVVIAQHMPPRFTAAFAERLDREVALQVREAVHGDRLEAGGVWIAPGGREMTVTADTEGLGVRVRRPPPGATYIPSVDALFASVAVAVGARALGVVLTGMGRDGREGVIALKRAGARTVAESEGSAIVHGMPEAATATGCIDRVVMLDEMAEVLRTFAADLGLRGEAGR